MGLNSEYEGVRSQILHREVLPDLDQAIDMVIKDEKRFKVSTVGSPVGNLVAFNSKRETAALGKESSGKYSSQESEGNQQMPNHLFFVYCKKRNHTKENYRKLLWKEKNKKKAYNTTSSGEVSELIGYKGKAQAETTLTQYEPRKSSRRNEAIEGATELHIHGPNR